MGRENKKEAVALLHRANIMKASQKLFSDKGFENTTISDISKASLYSRRTIYAYFENKDDILHHITEQGLILLKDEIEAAVRDNGGFIRKYEAVCAAIKKYQTECPDSYDNVNRANAENFDFSDLSETVKRILKLGNEINALLEDFLEKGKESGEVRKDVNSMMAVYVLWSSISSLITLVQTKGSFICKEFSVSEKEFLEYGFRQIINSVLEDRI